MDVANKPQHLVKQKTKPVAELLQVYHDWQPEYGLPEGFMGEDDSADQLRWLFSSDNPWFKLGKCTILLSDSDGGGDEDSDQTLDNKPTETFRLVIFIHPQVRFFRPNTAYFGFWRTTNNPSLNRQAFLLASQWLKHQKQQQLVGPINFNSFGSYRLQLDDFNGNNFAGEPSNPAYYAQLLINAKFDSKPCNLYQSQFVKLGGKPPQASIEKLQQLDKSLGNDFLLEQLTEPVWLEQSVEFHQITEMVFSNNPAYQHIDSNSFFQMVSKPLAKRFCQHCSLIVRDKKDQLIVAAYLVFPDWSQLTTSNPSAESIRKPLEDIDFQRDFKYLKSPTAIIKTAGTLVQFQGKGLMSWMNLSASINMHRYYHQLIGALASADNPSLKLVPRLTNSEKTGNIIRERQYGLFSKQL
ncbi:hypothetical protein [Pelagibaculum spongiae]|nr:hypothetical protein [Pelagibaculum spongiae]